MGERGNLDANRRERMIRADCIPAFSWDWPIMPGIITITIIAVIMMRMILHYHQEHQVRHGRQDNHATNHVRCAETSKAKQKAYRNY
jgi:hypothetical protein